MALRTDVVRPFIFLLNTTIEDDGPHAVAVCVKLDPGFDAEGFSTITEGLGKAHRAQLGWADITAFFERDGLSKKELVDA